MITPVTTYQKQVWGWQCTWHLHDYLTSRWSYLSPFYRLESWGSETLKTCQDTFGLSQRYVSGFMMPSSNWGLTDLTGQVPLGFGCQEGQGVKTQIKRFRLLVFPAALIQFLRVGENRSSWSERTSLRLYNNFSRRQSPITSFHRNPETQRNL